MKVESDPIMMKVEGKNGRCFIQFEGGEPVLWGGGTAYCSGRLDNLRTLENFLNMIIKQVGE
jgi:hypothetical protein